MTGQTLLNYIELVNNELQLQSGEPDVVRGLLALNVAQDYFEARAAVVGKMFGSGSGTMLTVTGVETTASPTGLLRLDRLQLLDSGATKVVRSLTKIHRAGGHRETYMWPANVVNTSSSSGAPTAYWTNGTLVYWAPLPDAVYTIRWYGFAAASDITASGTFSYPDIVAFPLAAFAARLMKLSVDDATADLSAVAEENFAAVIKTLSNAQRDGASGFEYTQIHQA